MANANAVQLLPFHIFSRSTCLQLYAIVKYITYGPKDFEIQCIKALAFSPLRVQTIPLYH